MSEDNLPSWVQDLTNHLNNHPHITTNTTIITNKKKLKRYGEDKSHHPHVDPIMAVVPESIEAVAAVVRFCYENRIVMTVQGAGTGLEGGCVPYSGGVVISTKKLQRLDYDKENNYVWVGAGVKKMELNKYLKPFGRLLGPDPSSNPSLGGMASTGGSGMTTSKFGTTPENIISLKVVTTEGKIIKTRQAVRKSSTGLDLTHLYCSSEGTLGIICELLVKTHRLPSLRCGSIVVFEHTKNATDTVVEVSKLSLGSLLKCEMLNVDCVIAGNKYFKTQLQEKPTLLVEMTGDDIELIRKDWEKFFSAAKKNGVLEDYTKFVEHGEELDQVWESRRGCYVAAFDFRGVESEHIYISDVCVPLSNLSECLVKTEDDCHDNGAACILCAHILDGNFHALIPYANEEEKERMKVLSDRLSERAISLGGTVSGEHGVGIGKVKFLKREHGEEHIRVQWRIKQALDPHNLLNPGKFYPPASSL